jgi:predicted lipid carrier protein YhbT
MRAAIARWFARRVGGAKPERLERTMRGPLRRRAVLWVIFRAMPRLVRRRALERENVVVEWRITGRADGGRDVRQLVIEDGAAAVHGAQREPDLTVTIDGVDFLLVATGNASAPTLFVRRELEIDGDPWLALRLPRLFALGAKMR